MAGGAAAQTLCKNLLANSFDVDTEAGIVFEMNIIEIVAGITL